MRLLLLLLLLLRLRLLLLSVLLWRGGRRCSATSLFGGPAAGYANHQQRYGGDGGEYRRFNQFVPSGE